MVRTVISTQSRARRNAMILFIVFSAVENLIGLFLKLRPSLVCGPVYTATAMAYVVSLTVEPPTSRLEEFSGKTCLWKE